MNGNGMPIIGAKPIVIPIFISKWIKSMDATQYPYTLQNCDFCFSAKKMIRNNRVVKTSKKIKLPKNPHSSPIVQKIKLG